MNVIKSVVQMVSNLINSAKSQGLPPPTIHVTHKRRITIMFAKGFHFRKRRIISLFAIEIKKSWTQIVQLTIYPLAICPDSRGNLKLLQNGLSYFFFLFQVPFYNLQFPFCNICPDSQGLKRNVIKLLEWVIFFTCFVSFYN